MLVFIYLSLSQELTFGVTGVCKWMAKILFGMTNIFILRGYIHLSFSQLTVFSVHSVQSAARGRFNPKASLIHCLHQILEIVFSYWKASRGSPC